MVYKLRQGNGLKKPGNNVSSVEQANCHVLSCSACILVYLCYLFFFVIGSYFTILVPTEKYKCHVIYCTNTNTNHQQQKNKKNKIILSIVINPTLGHTSPFDCQAQSRPEILSYNLLLILVC